MAEKPVHSKSSEIRGHAPPATAKPVGALSDPHFPRRGQSHFDPRWSGRLTLPPRPSLVSRSRPQSSHVSPRHPILAIPNIHRPSWWQKCLSVNICSPHVPGVHTRNTLSCTPSPDGLCPCQVPATRPTLDPTPLRKRCFIHPSALLYCM